VRRVSASHILRRERPVSSLDLLVAGLGNPGREYERTRHNVGWMVADELARRHGGSWRGKFSGRIAEVRLDGARVALLKPETYMNESGRAVAPALRFYKLDPGALLVVHDEGDFDLGRLQARAGGGLAGHNGLRSVARHLGTPEFLRLRVGVGRPNRGDPRSLSDFVLSDFEPDDDPGAVVARAADAVETVVREGLEVAQQRFN
jgi:PTH1 family peptidyl-tRNA hydrolase